MERLDKVIANMGGASRREVREMVKQGRVLVNGTAATAADMKVDPAVSHIIVDGVPLHYQAFTYLLLHKPGGVLTATEDRTQQTVLDLLPEEYRRRNLVPVGRLDKDTEGLLLLTNDGELNHRITSPKYHVDKVYYAEVDGILEAGDVETFAAGIALQDFTCLPAQLEILSQHTCYVTVAEGKFHQVKRMLAYCGKPVVYLKRLRIGPVHLEDTLPAGSFRPLTAQEICELRYAVNL